MNETSRHDAPTTTPAPPDGRRGASPRSAAAGAAHAPVRSAAGLHACVAALLCAAAVVAGCASPTPVPVVESDALRERIVRGDLAGADALLAERADRLDARRALDLAIRAGRVDATRHFVQRTGPDVELDLDGTTPLIRAVREAPPADRGALVALLLEAGAHPDLTDRYGRSARDYATVRNRGELFADARAADRPAAFASWLGATRVDPRPAAGDALADASQARGAGKGAGGSAASRSASTRGAAAKGAAANARGAAARTPTAASPGTPAARAAAARSTRATPPSRDARPRTPPAPAPTVRAVDVATLLRQSPWVPAPDVASADRVALRFHADGVADVLHRRAGRLQPMPAAAAAWRVEGDRLMISIVADAFVVACAGSPRADGTLRIACEERDAPPRLAPAARLDVARSLLQDLDPAGRGPSLLAIATGRAATSADVTAPTGPLAARPRYETTLAGLGAPTACRAAASRVLAPAVGAPSARPGDWYAFDAKRFEAISPLSGRMCAQTVARDAALAACADGACRSAGGCPAGQASALAGLPGVASAWVGCGADALAARERALSACRASLGCDCQLVAMSGRNVDTVAGGACTVASR